MKSVSTIIRDIRIPKQCNTSFLLKFPIPESVTDVKLTVQLELLLHIGGFTHFVGALQSAIFLGDGVVRDPMAFRIITGY